MEIGAPCPALGEVSGIRLHIDLVNVHGGCDVKPGLLETQAHAANATEQI
jgi:hypothetical protein